MGEVDLCRHIDLMRAVGFIGVFLPLCLSRPLPEAFVAWSQECSLFTSYTISNEDLVADQMVHQLNEHLLLEIPGRILIEDSDTHNFPEAIEDFFELVFHPMRMMRSMNFPSGRVLFEFLRVIDALERTNQPGETFSRLSATIIDIHSFQSLERMTSAEAKVWADRVIARVCPDVRNASISLAHLEWILRMKHRYSLDIQNYLRSTHDKIIFWAHQKKDPLNVCLGMKYTRATNSYTGNNLLGKLWMRIRDSKVPIFVNDWFTVLNNRERSITTGPSGMLSSEIVAVSDQDPSVESLDFASQHPVCLTDTDAIVPADIRTILSVIGQGSFELVFSSSAILYHFLRIIRCCQALGHSAEVIGNMIRATDYREIGNLPILHAAIWASHIIGEHTHLRPPVSDFEWILNIKYIQNACVQTALRATGTKHIITLGSFGMSNLSALACTAHAYSGCNLVGKTWMKIRERLLASSVTQSTPQDITTPMDPYHSDTETATRLESIRSEEHQLQNHINAILAERTQLISRIEELRRLATQLQAGNAENQNGHI